MRLKFGYLRKYDTRLLTWLEYHNITYVPFTSQDSVETSIYGFIDISKPVEFIAGTNFFERRDEKKLRKLRVNPHPIVIKGTEQYGSYDQYNLGNNITAEDYRVIEASQMGGSPEYWQKDILGLRVIAFLKPIISYLNQEKNTQQRCQNIRYRVQYRTLSKSIRRYFAA